MNLEIAQSLYGYFETLYNNNVLLIKLCGSDCIDNLYFNCSSILKIIQDIPRIIPYESKKNKKLIILTDNNGLMEYKTIISYLEMDYKNILNKNYNFLENVRKIRNKYEHKMHDIKINSSTSSGYNLDIEFLIKGKEKNENIIVELEEFIELFKDLNNLFSKISKDVQKFLYSEFKEKINDNKYNKKLNRFDFNDFNEIFDCKLLRKIGKFNFDF